MALQIAGSLDSEYQRLLIHGSGLVCLPAAGNRNGSSFNNGGKNGNYWSATPNTNNANNAYNLYFNSSNVNPANNNNRNNGYSVRLVFGFLSPFVVV